MKSGPFPLTLVRLKLSSHSWKSGLRSASPVVQGGGGYWVDAIHAEDRSRRKITRWWHGALDDAGFKLHDAELEAKKARDAYKSALRKKNYGF